MAFGTIALLTTSSGTSRTGSKSGLPLSCYLAERPLACLLDETLPVPFAEEHRVIGGQLHRLDGLLKHLAVELVGQPWSQGIPKEPCRR